MQLQRAEDEAEAKKDVAALDRLLSDDFILQRQPEPSPIRNI
jgi:hypothetical protein